MPTHPILSGPRQGWSGRLLDGLSGIPGIGAPFARAQRIRRKRLRESISKLQSPPGNVFDSETARNFEASLHAWCAQPPISVPLPPMEGVHGEQQRRCSVIINTVDRAAELECTLRDLANHWQDDLDELIVVLGPTEDQSREVIARSAVRCKVIECPERNLAISRNLGLAAATGNYVAYLDDDASPCANWLEELLKPLEDNPACGVSAGFAMDGNGERFLTRHVVADPLGDSIWMETSEQAKEVIRGEPGRFLTATGCNMAFRRDQLLELGGFDPFYAYFLEETDLVLRLHQQGFPCTAAPQSKVLHRQGTNLARSPEASVSSRLRMIRSQIHFIGKFALGTVSSGKIQGSLWRRALLDLERIAWENPRGNAPLQAEYLRNVTKEFARSGSH